MWKNVWFEQDGKWEDLRRPVLILKVANKQIFIWIPLTKTIRNWTFYFNFNFDTYLKSSVVLPQIRSYDQKRLIKKIWKMSAKNFDELKNKLKESLSL